MNEKMSFKMGVKFAASFYTGKNFLDGMACIYMLQYNQCENKLNQ